MHTHDTYKVRGTRPITTTRHEPSYILLLYVISDPVGNSISLSFPQETMPITFTRRRRRWPIRHPNHTHCSGCGLWFCLLFLSLSSSFNTFVLLQLLSSQLLPHVALFLNKSLSLSSDLLLLLFLPSLS